MIALFLTFAVASYLLGPDLVSRWVLGLVCARKNIVQSKGEEVTRAVAWAMVPLSLAIGWAWCYGTLLKCARWPEWKLFFAGAYSDAYFEKNTEAVFHATKAVFWWNFSVLWRMYFLVLLFSICIDFGVYNFGLLRRLLKGRGWIRKSLRWLLSFFIIPRVSEWHVFLSDMLADRKDIKIHADIITKGDLLYRGEVVDKTLNAEGSLNCLILASPLRFRRIEYLEAKKTAATKPILADYWAPIPGNTFIMMASEIVSINLTHTSPSEVQKDTAIVEAARRAITGNVLG